MDSLTEFIKFIQGCITPVAMISGVGLALLTITNSRGRVVDRIRQLVNEIEKLGDKEKKLESKKAQLRIFYKRALLLKSSIMWIIIGVISSSSIIPLIFIMNWTSLNLSYEGYMLFIIAIVSMLNAFIYFLRDVNLSLDAIELEIKDHIK
jgi:hypothetical protein